MLETLLLGGPLFMGILTVIFIILIIQIVRGFLTQPSTDEESKKHAKNIEIIKGIALLGITTGILGNLIGFYTAFEQIEIMGNISTGVLAGGLKISLITPLYGLIIFITGRTAALALLART